MERQVSELRKNEGLRAMVKRDVFGRLLGMGVGRTHECQSKSTDDKHTDQANAYDKT